MGLIQITGDVSLAPQSRSRLFCQTRFAECPAKSFLKVLVFGFDPTQLTKIILEATHAD
jgi:hypothetical protein